MWPTDRFMIRVVTGRLIDPLIVIAVTGALIVAVQVGATPAAEAQVGCGNIPLISDACDLATDPFEWAWDQATGIAGEVVEGAFDYFAGWVATAAIGALHLLADAMESTTTPNVSGSTTTHGISLAIARAMALPLLMLTGLWALVKREAQMIAKAAFLYLPGTVIGMYAAIWGTERLLEATDGFSDAYAGAGEGSIRAFADSIAGLITAGVGITSPGLLVIFSVILILATVMVWMVMLIRAAAILVTYAFMPIAFAGLLFPATRGWIKRLVEIQLSFILSKMVIVGIFALGADVLTSADNALAGMMQASALFALAAFSPFAIMRIIPFVSNEAMSAMERPASTPMRVATTAAGTAGGIMLYRHLQSGQQAGPIGGGGASGGATSAAGAGGGGGAAAAGGAVAAGVQAGVSATTATAGATGRGLASQPAATRTASHPTEDGGGAS